MKALAKGHHDANCFESREAPFDYVSWVPAISRATDANSSDALNAAARYLALEWTPDVRAMLRSCRVSPTPREQSCGQSLTLRMSGYASLADQKREFIGELASDLADAVKASLATNDTSADWERLD